MNRTLKILDLLHFWHTSQYSSSSCFYFFILPSNPLLTIQSLPTSLLLGLIAQLPGPTGDGRPFLCSYRSSRDRIHLGAQPGGTSTTQHDSINVEIRTFKAFSPLTLRHPMNAADFLCLISCKDKRWIGKKFNAETHAKQHGDEIGHVGGMDCATPFLFSSKWILFEAGKHPQSAM